MPLPKFRRGSARPRNRQPTSRTRFQSRFAPETRGGRGPHGGARQGGKRLKDIRKSRTGRGGGVPEFRTTGRPGGRGTSVTRQFITGGTPLTDRLARYLSQLPGPAGRAGGTVRQYMPGTPEMVNLGTPYEDFTRYGSRQQAVLDRLGLLPEQVFDPNPYSRYAARGRAPVVIPQLKSMPKNLEARPDDDVTDLIQGNYPSGVYPYGGYGFGGGGGYGGGGYPEEQQQARGAQFGTGERRPTGRGRTAQLRDKRWYQNLTHWRGF